MSFRIGQKVVCIKVGLWTIEQNFPGWCAVNRPRLPRNGDVLTIREITSDDGDDFPYLLFEEIDNSWCPARDGSEVRFGARRFRHILERKTDISIFTEMLKPRELVRSHD